MAEQQTELKSLGKGEHGQIWAQWSFPEFSKYQRGFGWYFLMGLIGLLLIIRALKTGNFLFAIIIILIAFIFILLVKKEPLEVNFRITEQGIEVGSSFYEWSRVENFWLIYKPPEVKRLYFKLKRTLSPLALSIPLEKEHPVKIRKILLKYALEDLSKEDESLADFLSRSLKI